MVAVNNSFGVVGEAMLVESSLPGSWLALPWELGLRGGSLSRLLSLPGALFTHGKISIGLES